MKVINLEETCGGCPTIFEWENSKGEFIYFRLRGSIARIVNETRDKIIISSDYMDGFDGVCNFKDVKKWAKSKGLKLKQS
jgi:hypothetical protein